MVLSLDTGAGSCTLSFALWYTRQNSVSGQQSAKTAIGDIHPQVGGTPGLNPCPNRGPGV